MFCYRCNNQAGYELVCPTCGADLRFFQKARKLSNVYYNEGLKKASVRNISGAISSLKRSLKFYKYNIEARNLLGLCYLEIGETVDALSEWIISKNYQPEDNRANFYMEEIQNNKSRLDMVNQTIKKYNQALLYCKQDSRDLAIIQLKKVLGLNPKLVKGHQLLALLYMQEGRLEQAKKVLRAAAKIDSDNTTTLRYLKETNRRIKEENPTKAAKSNDDLISYQNGNETIIMPKRFKETSFGATLIALIAGVIVGAAVINWLVVPSVRRKAQSQAKEKLVEANDTISQNSQMITSLQEQIAALQGDLDAQTGSAEANANKSASYDNLCLAYSSYLASDIVKSGEYLSLVNSELLSEDAQAAYNALSGLVSEQYLQSAYNAGYQYYIQEDFANAVANLQAVVNQNQDYDDGQAAYYLAQSLRKGGDLDGAKPYYQYVVDNYPGTERARTSARYIE